VVSEAGRVGKGEGEGGSAGIDAKETGDKVKEEKAEVWTPTLAHYAGYTEREILASGAPEAILRCVPSPSFYRIPRYPRCFLMISADAYLVRRYILRPVARRHEGLYRKWAGKGNMKVSAGLLLVPSFSLSLSLLLARLAR
jgi:hypothetical protein